MGLGEGQGHSRPLQVYNMRNFPSRSECLALWSLGNEKELCGYTWHIWGASSHRMNGGIRRIDKASR
jgi:hypothetical protein